MKKQWTEAFTVNTNEMNYKTKEKKCRNASLNQKSVKTIEGNIQSWTTYVRNRYLLLLGNFFEVKVLQKKSRIDLLSISKKISLWVTNKTSSRIHCTPKMKTSWQQNRQKVLSRDSVAKFYSTENAGWSH